MAEALWLKWRDCSSKLNYVPPARSSRLQRASHEASMSETAKIGRDVTDNLMPCSLSLRSPTIPNLLLGLSFFPVSQTILFSAHLVELQLAWGRAGLGCQRAAAAGLPSGTLCQQDALGHTRCCVHAASQHMISLKISCHKSNTLT